MLYDTPFSPYRITTMTRFRIVAKEGNYGSGQYEVSDVKFYDIIKDGILSADPSTTGGKKVTKMPSTISIARLLGGVNVIRYSIFAVSYN